MILPLEKQVCSLESAKRLKKLGVRQESLFYWYNHPQNDGYKIMKEWDGAFCVTDWISHGPIYSAYTVAELGELLIKVYGGCGIETMLLDTGIFCFPQVKYRDVEHIKARHEFMDTCLQNVMPKTEAEARARMLAYLIERSIDAKAK